MIKHLEHTHSRYMNIYIYAYMTHVARRTQLEITIKYTLVYIVRGEQAFKRHTQGLQSADGDKGTRGFRDRSSTVRERERERANRDRARRAFRTDRVLKESRDSDCCRVNEIIEHR